MKEVLGCYKININKKINEGSQAQIFECVNTDKNWPCCARVINKTQLNNIISSQSFEKEIKVLENLKWLRHQNLLTIYDYKEEENYIYQFTELCDQSLLDHMRSNQTITRAQFLDFIIQISSGYLELIKYNIIHRDLKPENILIKNFQNKIILKICDFGISKIIDQSSRLNTYNVGTQFYSSPEMLLQASNYSYESDIFSFGIILYEQITEKVCLYNNDKQQKEFYEQLKKKSFKQILMEKYPDNCVQGSILDLLDLLIVYDPQKRINWKDLNQLATSQYKDYISYNQPISSNRNQRGDSMYENYQDSTFTENFNNLNLQNSQVREFYPQNNIAQAQNSFAFSKRYVNQKSQITQSLNQNQINFFKAPPQNNRQNLCHTISFNKIPQTNQQQQYQLHQPQFQQQYQNQQYMSNNINQNCN